MDNTLDTHLSVLLVTNLVADIHQCRSSASILDKELNLVLCVVELQGLKQRQRCQGPMAPAEPGLSPFPVHPLIWLHHPLLRPLE